MGAGASFRGAAVEVRIGLVGMAGFRWLRLGCFTMLIGLRFMAGAIDEPISVVRDPGRKDTGSARW